MIWKRVFLILLSINLLILVGGLLWFTSFPTVQQSPGPPAKYQSNKVASVDLAIGQDAINTYLEYAVSQESDLSNALSYAKVQFSSDWDCILGIKLIDHVVSFNVTFNPVIKNGNLQLQVVRASLGQVPVPPSLLLLFLRRAPLPYWVNLDTNNTAIDVNFTQRAQNPYGVRILGYSPQTKQLTLRVSMVPKALLTSKTS